MGMAFQGKAAAPAREPQAKKSNPAPGQPMSEPDQGSNGAQEDISHMPIQEAVAQHGPADKIEMEHNHESGQHTVTSHHKGKKHHSSHGSAQEAHDQAKAASGAEQDAPQPGQPEGESNAIPGMQKQGY